LAREPNNGEAGKIEEKPAVEEAAVREDHSNERKGPRGPGDF